MMFSPNATTTRGMIVTVLYRLVGSPVVGDAAHGVPRYEEIKIEKEFNCIVHRICYGFFYGGLRKGFRGQLFL